MKALKQKREEAADRLERYAREIERGEHPQFGPQHDTDTRTFHDHAEKRRTEAARLRSL